MQLNGEDETDSRIRNRIKHKVQGKVISRQEGALAPPEKPKKLKKYA